MKVATILDDDGHFSVSFIHDRFKTLNMLKQLDNGQHYYEIIGRYELEDKNPWLYKTDEWADFISSFVQCGKFEVVEI